MEAFTAIGSRDSNSSIPFDLLECAIARIEHARDLARFFFSRWRRRLSYVVQAAVVALGAITTCDFVLGVPWSGSKKFGEAWSWIQMVRRRFLKRVPPI